MIDYTELGWWYWLVIACLLTAAMAGYPAAYGLAVSTAALQCLHFAVRERDVAAFSVQVRIWYLALLIVASPQPLRAICWAPLAGTWIRLAFGYCMMARCVSLLAWNRSEPVSWRLLRRTFLSRPVPGNVLHGLGAQNPR